MDQNYTSDEKYDILVVVFYSLRISFLFCVFFLNLFQTIFEFIHLRRFNKPINPRFCTFLSITLFPLCRTIEQFLFLFTYPRRGIGSLPWYLSIFGTYFTYTEWIFIGCYWTQLLYTYFFFSNAIVLKNTKRVWKACIVLAALLLAWDIILVILGYEKVKGVEKASQIISISFIILYGVAILINGMILVRFMKSQEKKIPRLQATIAKTTRLASVLLILVVSSFASSLVINFAIKLDMSSDYRYVTAVIFALIEVGQVITVMAALGGESPRNYFLFKRVNETASSGSKSSHSGGSGNLGGGHGHTGSSLSLSKHNREISLSSLSSNSSNLNNHYNNYSESNTITINIQQSQPIDNNNNSINNNNNSNNNNNINDTNNQNNNNNENNPPMSAILISNLDTNINLNTSRDTDNQNNNNSNNDNNNNNNHPSSNDSEPSESPQPISLA